MKRKYIVPIVAGGILGVCAAVFTYKKVKSRKTASAPAAVSEGHNLPPEKPVEEVVQPPVSPEVPHEEALIAPEFSPEKIYQYDTNFSVVGTYDTIEAARAAVPSKYRGTVGKALRGQLLSAGGYFWSIGTKPFDLDEIPEKWKKANPIVPYKGKGGPRPSRSASRRSGNR